MVTRLRNFATKRISPYNVYYGDVAKIIHILPTKEYILLIVDIPYAFCMVESTYDDEPFMLKQLEKMMKDFTETIPLWKIVAFHRMDQEYSIAQALRFHCHRI